MEANDRERRITVEDTITGHGQHAVQSRIHLHPDVQVQGDQETIQLQRGGCTVHLSTADSMVRVEKGWYCPEFGARVERTVIVIEARGSLPVRISYSIRY